MERAMLEFLANALWQLPVLAAGAWGLLWLTKPGPQTQYRVWLAVLGFAVLLPAWGIRSGTILAAPGTSFDPLATTRTVQRSAGVVAVDATVPLVVASVPPKGEAAKRETAKAMWRLPSRVQRVHLSAVATHWVMGVYVGSVLLGLLRVGKAWHSARGLVQVSQEVALCSAAETVLREFGKSFDVSLPEVRECAAVTSPMVVGAVSPVVLLPEGFAGHAEDEVRAALLHEMAHVKRRDYFTNGLCQLAVLPVNWHPVAHVVQQKIRRTREMACDEMAAREMRSDLGYARCLVTMARGMLGGGGLAERPEFVGLFSNNVLEERVMRLMETKTALSARAKLVRLVSGATAMAAATLMATAFHVVPTMAAESEAGSPPVQMAVLRATVLSSADATVGAPVCVHRLAKPAVAPVAPVAATRAIAASAPASATRVVAPAAVVFAAPYVTAAAAPVALQAPQSVPAMTPPSPVGAPASPAIAPAPVTPPALQLAPVTPTTPAMAPVAPMAPVDKEKSQKKSGYVYRMSPDGEVVVSINGNVRVLTAEEQKQIEKAMEQFRNGDFAKHMADLQREMADLRINNTFDSREFRQDMEAAQRGLAQSALVNNAELHAKIQAMVKNFDKQNMYIGHCKDGVVKDKDKDKDKDKAKQKQPVNP
jgi:beta-lactamase regulating signal transducer with metallopeptidase domain